MHHIIADTNNVCFTMFRQRLVVSRFKYLDVHCRMGKVHHKDHSYLISTQKDESIYADNVILVSSQHPQIVVA